MATLQLMSLDAGNAQIKAVSADGRNIVFPHALRQLSASDIEEMNIRKDTTNPNLFIVNGIHYAIGEQALRSGPGSALFGEARYTETYYGVLVAIALFRLFPKGERNVFVYGSHTPKDIIYRQDLVLSAKGNWTVESQGQRKTFRVVDAAGYEEPVGAFRHATLSDDPRRFRGAHRLRKGDCVIIDIGGFTVGITTAVDSMIDYTSASTAVTGVLDVLSELEKLIRSKYRRALKGTNRLNPMRLRRALTDGVYDAGGLGNLDCAREVEEACNLLLNDILKFFQEYGDAASFDSVLLAGGGGALLEKRIRQAINHRYVYVAEENRDLMHLATASGGMKILRLLEAKGEL